METIQAIRSRRSIRKYQQKPVPHEVIEQIVADAAYTANETAEDIGARRLHAVFEQLLEDISFNAGDEDMPPVELKIDGDYVRAHLSGENKPVDLRRYIL